MRDEEEERRKEEDEQSRVLTLDQVVQFRVPPKHFLYNYMKNDKRAHLVMNIVNFRILQCGWPCPSFLES